VQNKEDIIKSYEITLDVSEVVFAEESFVGKFSNSSS
jgi:hypothetical protein